MSPIQIIRIVALVVAVVTVFITIPYAVLILIVLGLAAGFMGVNSDERVLYLVFAVALATVSTTLSPIPVIGYYLSDILGNVSTIVNAGAIAVILTMIKERVMN